MKTKPYYLATPEVSLQHFSWCKEAGTLTAFASDFGPLGTEWMGRLYNDACDVGFTIRSHHSSECQRFVLEREEVRDGDLVAWHFTPESNLGTVSRVTIWND